METCQVRVQMHDHGPPQRRVLQSVPPPVTDEVAGEAVAPREIREDLR